MEVDYSQYYYHRSNHNPPRRAKRRIRWRVIIIITVLAACITGGIFLFFGLRSNQTGDLALNQAAGVVEIGKRGFYAVEMGAFQSVLTAESYAKGIQQRGGAGYVYASGSTHYVLAGVYSMRTDAEKVVSNLRAEGESVQFLEITIEECSLKAGKSNLEDVYAAVKELYAVFDSLQKNIYAIDRSTVTNAQSAISSSERFMEDVSKLSEEDDVGAFFYKLASAFKNLPGTGSAAEISRNMKYIYAKTVCMFSDFILSYN